MGVNLFQYKTEFWSFGVHISAWLEERCSEKSQWRHVSLMRVLSLIISFL